MTDDNPNPDAPETGDDNPEPDDDGRPDVPDRLPDDHPAAQALAKANEEAKNLRLKVKEFEDRDKTEQERSAERIAELEKSASSSEAKAMRLEAALEHAPDGMGIAQIRKLAKRLQGDTAEELAADAEELFAEFAPEDSGGDSTTRRPKERLRPGASPDAEPAPDGAELADRIWNAKRSL